MQTEYEVRSVSWKRQLGMAGWSPPRPPEAWHGLTPRQVSLCAGITYSTAEFIVQCHRRQLDETNEEQTPCQRPKRSTRREASATQTCPAATETITGRRPRKRKSSSKREDSRGRKKTRERQKHAQQDENQEDQRCSPQSRSGSPSRDTKQCQQEWSDTDLASTPQGGSQQNICLPQPQIDCSEDTVQERDRYLVGGDEDNPQTAESRQAQGECVVLIDEGQPWSQYPEDPAQERCRCPDGFSDDDPNATESKQVQDEFCDDDPSATECKQVPDEFSDDYPNATECKQVPDEFSDDYPNATECKQVPDEFSDDYPNATECKQVLDEISDDYPNATECKQVPEGFSDDNPKATVSKQVQRECDAQSEEHISQDLPSLPEEPVKHIARSPLNDCLKKERFCTLCQEERGGQHSKKKEQYNKVVTVDQGQEERYKITQKDCSKSPSKSRRESPKQRCPTAKEAVRGRARKSPSQLCMKKSFQPCPDNENRQHVKARSKKRKKKKRKKKNQAPLENARTAHRVPASAPSTPSTPTSGGPILNSLRSLLPLNAVRRWWSGSSQQSTEEEGRCKTFQEDEIKWALFIVLQCHKQSKPKLKRRTKHIPSKGSQSNIICPSKTSANDAMRKEAQRE